MSSSLLLPHLMWLPARLLRHASARAAALFLAAFAAAVLPWSAGAQDCIDYGEYLHWVGSVDTPGLANGVAVDGDYAYVADYASGLQVVDISDPASPAIVGSADTPHYACDVAVVGRYAYVADYASGLQVVDISNPVSPAIVGSVDTPGSAFGVAVDGDYAYVADYASGLQVVDISNPVSPAIVGSADTPGSAYGVAVEGECAYIADRDWGLQVVDISEPALPAIVGSADTPGSAYGVAVDREYAYVADYASGLQVVDISDSASPAIVGSVDTPGFACDVAVDGEYAYVADHASGLQVVDISDPASPAIVGSVDTPGFAYDVAVDGEHAYVGDQAFGLQIADITTPTDPPIVGSVDTPGEAYSVTVAGNYAYIADGSSGLQVVDISNPISPEIVGSVLLTESGEAQAENVVVSGHHAYVSGWDPRSPFFLVRRSIWVIDIADPTDPVIVSRTPTYGGVRAVAGDYAYATGSLCVYYQPAPPPPYNRLEVIDASIPAAPALVGLCETPKWTKDLALTGSYALVTTFRSTGGIPECLGGRNSLQVVDVSNPTAPTIVAGVNIPESGPIGVVGHYAYVAGRSYALSPPFLVIDITNPTIPTVVGNVNLPEGWWVSGLAVLRSYAYVAGGYREGLCVIDITNPTAPNIAAVNAICYGDDVAVAGRYVYMSGEEYGLRIYPVQCPAATAVAVSSFDAMKTPAGISVTWTTSFESDHLGFRVHRATRAEGDYLRLTELIEPPGPYRYLDAGVTPGTTYFYRLEAVDRSGGREFYGPVVATAVAAAGSPRFMLSQNQPNPFVASGGETVIGFSLGRRAHAKLRIFDATGRLVRALADEPLDAGRHAVWWDGRTDGDRETGPGIYYYRLDADEFSEGRTLVKLK